VDKLLDNLLKNSEENVEISNKSEITNNDILKLSKEALIELLSLLNNNRCEDYQDWRNIIWAIKSVCYQNNEDESEYLQIAHEFSRKTTKNNYDFNSVKKTWEYGKPGIINSGTLLYMLKQDNPVNYRSFKVKYNLIKSNHRELKPEDVKEWVCKQLDLKLKPEDNIHVIEYIEPKIRQFDIQYKTHIVNSPMATEKSKQTRLFFKNNELYTSLWITNRQLYAKNLEADLKECGFEVINYLDEDFKYHDDCIYEFSGVKSKIALIIQVESLYKLKTTDFDLVSIDEASSIMSQLDSPLHKDKIKLNKVTLDRILKESKYCVVLDDRIDRRSIELLQSNRSGPYLLQINKYQPFKYEVNIYDNRNILVSFMIDEFIKKGKNIVIVTPSLKFGRKIERILIENKINYRFYNGEDNTYNNELLNVKENWTKFQVLMFTGKICNGIDFHEPHYEALFVFGNNNIGTVDDLKQQIGRIRNLSSGKIFVNNKTWNECNLPVTHSAVRKYVIDKLNKKNEIFDNLVYHYTRKVYNKKFYNDLEDNFWSWLSIENMRLQFLSKKYYGLLFEEIFNRKGYIINHINTYDKKTDKLINEKLTICEAEYFSDLADRFNKCSVISEDEAKELKVRKEKSLTTYDENLQLIKHEILNLVKDGIDLPGSTIINIKDNLKQLINANLEKSTPVEQLLRNLMKNEEKYKNNPYFKAEFCKLYCIKSICSSLGINTTTDREKVWTEQDLLNTLPFFTENFTTFNLIFDLHIKKPPSDRTSLVKYINNILRKWSKCSLKSNESRSRKNNSSRTYTYTLQADEYFDNALSVMKPIDIFNEDQVVIEIKKRLFKEDVNNDRCSKFFERCKLLYSKYTSENTPISVN
jgi:hypothetical protein